MAKANMPQDDFRPIPSAPIGTGFHCVTLKLPCGWERDPNHADRLVVKLPTAPTPEKLLEELRTHLGDFAEMAYEQVYKLSMIKTLKDSMV